MFTRTHVAGLCLEGARWDKEDGVLKDSLPNQLHPALPVVQVGSCHAKPIPEIEWYGRASLS